MAHPVHLEFYPTDGARTIVAVKGFEWEPVFAGLNREGSGTILTGHIVAYVDAGTTAEVRIVSRTTGEEDVLTIMDTLGERHRFSPINVAENAEYIMIEARVLSGSGAVWVTEAGGLASFGEGTEIDLPVVLVQPSSVAVTEGGNAVFSVLFDGATTLQWYRDSVLIAGATAVNYSISGATVAADHLAQFYCIGTNSAGGTQTNSAILTVNAPGPTWTHSLQVLDLDKP